LDGSGAYSGMHNITAEGHGQEWRSLNGNITVGASATLYGVEFGFPAGFGPGTPSSSIGAAHGGMELLRHLG